MYCVCRFIKNMFLLISWTDSKYYVKIYPYQFKIIKNWWFNNVNGYHFWRSKRQRVSLFEKIFAFNWFLTANVPHASLCVETLYISWLVGFSTPYLYMDLLDRNEIIYCQRWAKSDNNNIVVAKSSRDEQYFN